MDLITLEKQIKTGNINKPVFIFAGPEDFLKEKSFQAIVEKLIPPKDRADNVSRSDSKHLNEILQKVFGFAFNTSPRIFFIKDIDTAITKHREEFIEKLNQNGIPAETIIIFSTSDNKTAGELTTKFKQQSDRIDFWAPFSNQLVTWVKKETAEQGCEITTGAADLLIELIGSDLAILHQELSKLTITSKGKKIGISEVNANVAYLRQDNIFDFLEAFGRRNSAKAIKCLESMVNRGEALQKIWFMLCRQLRDFRLLHSLRKDRPDLFDPIFEILEKYRQIADKSDFKSNQSKKSLLLEIRQLADEIPEILTKATALYSNAKLRNMHLALSFSLEELIAAGKLLVETDKNFKSGLPSPLTALQKFVISFLHPAI